jgi:single-stranded-DNA-specific exonuclease
MDDAKKAVALFIEKDPSKALYIASLLQTDNNHRKEADKEITKDAISMIEENYIESSKKSTVLYSPEWHKGVIGIVASRLLERFYKPTIIFTKTTSPILIELVLPNYCLYCFVSFCFNFRRYFFL